eukprot:TRINITY_DN4238_c0_g1_i8.p1 TRINITY_DN4238_c0_g1~~TRINITY_DN4238_c0_g1_i8.p1  ORF type:complete len:1785 (-),score=403.12 TRINITY_DN4238_c0_g1_i8:23-5290(-)
MSPEAVGDEPGFAWSLDFLSQNSPSGAPSTILSEPVIAPDGTILIASQLMIEGNSTILYALNSDSSARWEIEFPNPSLISPPLMLADLPNQLAIVVIDNTAFQSTRKSNIYLAAFSLDTGAPLWNSTLDTSTLFTPPAVYLIPPTVVDEQGQRVFVCLYQYGQLVSRLLSVSLIDGSLLLNVTVNGYCGVELVLAKVNDTTSYLGISTDLGGISLVDPNTGAEVWFHPTSMNKIRFSSTIYNGVSYLIAFTAANPSSSTFVRIRALNLNNFTLVWQVQSQTTDAAIAENIRTSGPSIDTVLGLVIVDFYTDFCALNLQTGSRVWCSPEFTAPSRPLVSVGGGRLLVGSTNLALQCIDYGTSSTVVTKWSQPLNGIVGSAVPAVEAVSGYSILVLTNAYTLFAIRTYAILNVSPLTILSNPSSPEINITLSGRFDVSAVPSCRVGDFDAPVISLGPTQMVCRAPLHTTGPFSVLVSASMQGAFYSFSPQSITYYHVPELFSVTPNTLSEFDIISTPITITGLYFTQRTLCRFGDAMAVDVSLVEGSVLVLHAPQSQLRSPNVVSVTCTIDGLHYSTPSAAAVFSYSDIAPLDLLWPSAHSLVSIANNAQSPLSLPIDPVIATSRTRSSTSTLQGFVTSTNGNIFIAAPFLTSYDSLGNVQWSGGPYANGPAIELVSPETFFLATTHTLYELSFNNGTRLWNMTLGAVGTYAIVVDHLSDSFFVLDSMNCSRFSLSTPRAKLWTFSVRQILLQGVESGNIALAPHTGVVVFHVSNLLGDRALGAFSILDGTPRFIVPVASGPPCVVSEPQQLIFFLTPGMLIAYNLTSGATSWNVSLTTAADPSSLFSPLVCEARRLVIVLSPYEAPNFVSYIYAFDMSVGELVWSKQLSSLSFSSKPLLDRDCFITVVLSSSALVAFSPEDGSEVLRVPAVRGSINYAPVLLPNRRIFVASDTTLIWVQERNETVGEALMVITPPSAMHDNTAIFSRQPVLKVVPWFNAVPQSVFSVSATVNAGPAVPPSLLDSLSQSDPAIIVQVNGLLAVGATTLSFATLGVRALYGTTYHLGFTLVQANNLKPVLSNRATFSILGCAAVLNYSRPSFDATACLCVERFFFTNGQCVPVNAGLEVVVGPSLNHTDPTKSRLDIQPVFRILNILGQESSVQDSISVTAIKHNTTQVLSTTGGTILSQNGLVVFSDLGVVGLEYDAVYDLFFVLGSNTTVVVSASFLTASCPTGTYLADDRRACACNVGYENKDGVCIPCPAGQYKPDLGDQLCTPCPASSTTSSAAISLSECECVAGYFSPKNNTECEACYEGLVCGGGADVTVQDGYFRPDADSFKTYKCLSDACVNGGCRSGYRGPLCALCESGFGKISDFECVQCPPLVANVIIMMIIFAFFVALFTLLVRASDSPKKGASIVLKIAFNFVQMISFIGAFDVLWPQELAPFFQITQGATLTLNIVSLDCASNPTFYARLIAMFFLPLVILAVVATVYFVFPVVRRAVTREAGLFEAPTPHTLAAFQRSLMFSLYLAHPAIVRMALLTFGCTSVGKKSYLTVDFRLECDTAEHNRYVIASALYLIFYCGGLAVLAVYKLFVHRHEIANALSDEGAVAKYRFLVDGYTLPQFFFWEAAMVIRKLLVVFFGVVLSPIQQLFWGLLLLMTSLTAHMLLKPFREPVFNMLETLSLFACTVTLLFGVLFYYGDYSHTTFQGLAAFLFFGDSCVIAVFALVSLRMGLWDDIRAMLPLSKAPSTQQLNSL